MKSIKRPYLLAGVFLGAWGIYFLSGNPWWILGLPTQAVALWLLIKAFPKAFNPLLELGSTLSSSAKPKSLKSKIVRKKKADVKPPAHWFLFLTVVLLIGAASVLLQSRLLTQGVFLLAAVLVWMIWNRKKIVLEPIVLSRWREMTAVSLLLLLAALWRFPWTGFNFAGLQIDEANNLMSCLDVLDGTLKSPFFTAWWGNPAFTYFLAAGFLKIFGTKLVVGRCISSLDALLALFFFYKLCRLYFSLWASWIAAFLFSVSWWNLYFSFSPFHNMFTVFFETATLYFLLRSLREGKRWLFLVSGLFMAASVMSYLPGRLVPGMVFLILLILALTRGKKFIRAYWVPVSFMLFAFFWMVSPFIVFCVHNPGDFIGRTQELSVLKVMERTGDWFFPVKSCFFTFFTFFWPNTELDPRFGIPGVPILDAFAGGLVLLGLLLSLFTGAIRMRVLLWVGLAVGMATNAFAVQGTQPLDGYFNPMRCFITIPFLFLAAALALEWILQKAKRLPMAGRAILIFLILAGVIFSAAANGQTYFTKFSKDPGLWASLGFNHLLAAKAIEENAPLG
ncbi:MAG: ArnT family glycosyltransferase, partial [bacterium]